MNVDSPSNSINLSSCEVTSKYFSSKCVMDESLSDFQEKKNFTKAKTSEKVQKPTTSNSKSKKIKRIRGQKDIRTVLKSKKNELIEYSNDFDKICKQSGIDVDAEQLQLAIALSKSLTQTKTEVEEDSSSSPLTFQERTGKIRTTLQEYGFVVPEIKITATKRRKLKKNKKDYKLLLTTEAEKQQIISDKYSQVLFASLNNTGVNDSADNTNKLALLYCIATDTLYKDLKDNTIFYVDGLLEKSPSFVGCLLKDWTKIPGRALSPSIELPNINFERIACTPEELDTVLSGDIKAAQEIIKNKNTLLIEERFDSNNVESHIDKETDKNIKMDVDCIDIIEQEDGDINLLIQHNKDAVPEQNKILENTDEENSNLLKVTQSIRSYSPDIFDDEVTEIIDSSPKNLNCDITSKSITQLSYKTMELTECVTNIYSQTSIAKPIALSQGNNTTKRKSNDFMDITECVSSSQPIRQNIIRENIDLTQNSDDENNVSISRKVSKDKDIQSLDLTQSSSDTNDELPVVEISCSKSMDDTIILYEDEHQIIVKDLLGNKESTKTSDSEGLNKTQHASCTREPQYHDNGPITVDSEDEVYNPKHVQNTVLKEGSISPVVHITSNDNIVDNKIETVVAYRKTAKAQHISQEELFEKYVIKEKSKSESFFEDFVHRHSESSSKENTDVLCVDEESNNSIMYTKDGENINEKIDLTQKSDTSKETIENEGNNSPKSLIYSSSLGKIGNVSIDYDEVFDDMVRSQASSKLQYKSISSRSLTIDFNTENTDKPSKSDIVSNSSQNSETFEISDKELDYSLHQSRLDHNPKPNFDFGGISVLDDIPDLPIFRPSTNNIENTNINRSVSDSYFPTVDIGGIGCVNEDRTKLCSSISSTPCKETSKPVIAKTPMNGEYIIKTDEVTPMQDYERMTTPERNAELDKYGLKPFKRKRAIQLLTHLYNQTHPIVESMESLPSPSKRFKFSTNQQTSPPKRKSPRKSAEVHKTKKNTIQSPIKNNDFGEEEEEILDKENDIYDVTNEAPDLRNIECCEEDWVFQKREKAKLHSCRVPLHIAFHNYVIARRRLWEAILRYEPVNIDQIHKGLVANGFRYDPKDLLKFLDKKCITVKTADNNAKNKKHY